MTNGQRWEDNCGSSGIAQLPKFFHADFRFVWPCICTGFKLLTTSVLFRQLFIGGSVLQS